MTLIGKGSFSKVYRKGTSPTVIIESTDKAKECFSFGWGNESMLFPNIKSLGGYHYEMKYYPRCTAPKLRLNKLGYERYKLLRKLYTSNKLTDYSKIYEVFNREIKDTYLRDSLLSALDGLANYGDKIAFEISPRNISFTPSGRLILLDVFFFPEDLKL